MRILIIILLCFPFVLKAQSSFVTGLGGDFKETAVGIQVRDDDGFIILSNTNSTSGNGKKDIYIVGADKNGNFEWGKYFGSDKDDFASSIHPITNSRFLISGSVNGTDNDSALFLIVNDVGVRKIRRTFKFGSGRNVGQEAIQLADSGFIFTGYFGALNEEKLFVIRLDQNGDTLWTNTLSNNGRLMGVSALESDTGYTILAASDEHDGEFLNYAILQLDSVGDLANTNYYGGVSDDYPRAFVQTSDSNYLIAGYRTTSSRQWYLVKTASDGDADWIKLYGSAFEDEANSVSLTKDGDILLAGTMSSADKTWMHCKKLDMDGNEIWSKDLDDHISSSAWSISELADGRVLVTGHITDSVDNRIDQDILLAILEEDGHISSMPKIQTTELKVYPNPFMDELIIETEDPGYLTIYSLSGKEVYSKRINDQLTIIDPGSLLQGIYFYKLETQNAVKSGKIVKLTSSYYLEH